MSPERLLQNFDRLIDTPDAVPRLQRFILDLAVRGKLVEQNPEDEPAAELVKRIQVEKKSRTGRYAEMSQPTAKEIEQLFGVPTSWQWIRATEPAILISDNGKKVKTKDVLDSGKFPVVDQGKVFIRGFCNDIDKVIRVDEPIIIFGDHTRETKLIDFDFVVGADGVKLLKPIIINPAYYFLALQWVPLNSRGYGRHFKLLRVALFPLPPLAEQHRIVAKVDELMALCDELEAAQTKRERRRDRLVAATLYGLNNGENDLEAKEKFPFEESGRFYFNHLPRLTTRPEHIQQLRQSILTLAVRGKLVPQDPKDEPVSKVLERVFLENQNKWRELQLAKSGGKFRKAKSENYDNRFTEPVDPNIQRLPKLPVTWEWVCWESILAFGDESFRRGPFGSSLTKSIFVSSGYKVYEQYCPINDDCSFARYYITPQKYKELQGFAVKAKDFLISCSGVTLGRITQVPDEYEEGVINQALLRVRIENRLISDSFFKMLVRSPYFQRQIFSNSTGMAIPNVKGVKELKAIPLPLPPLAEQHRIVAKVEELMALCDELESRISGTTTIHRQFLEAILQEAINTQGELKQEAYR